MKLHPEEEEDVAPVLRHQDEQEEMIVNRKREEKDEEDVSLKGVISSSTTTTSKTLKSMTSFASTISCSSATTTTTTDDMMTIDSSIDNNNLIMMNNLMQLAGIHQPYDCSTLLKLNLPNCGLSSLPDSLPSMFPNLSTLFLPQNKFEELPAVLGDCKNLQMISFKDNGMKRIHPNALQSQLRWLILTGNQLTFIPDTIGRCNKLQKLMLSGNQLLKLPETIQYCTNLELIRLATNQLQEYPRTLLQLPNLCWVGLASNPFLQPILETKQTPGGLPELHVLDDPELSREDWPVLGQGAGGVTRKVLWKGQSVAVKTFSGALTSDGLPQDERAISVAVASLDTSASAATSSSSSCLISMLGQTPGGALVMEFLQGYTALAGPPSFETCSRDVYPRQEFMSWDKVWTIVTGLLQVLKQLHSQGICHGDFYSHNILISSEEKEEDDSNNNNNDTSTAEQQFQVKLSDFGAAFFYDRTSDSASHIERVEIRAFGVLVEELLQQVWNRNDNDGNLLTERRVEVLTDLVRSCRTSTATFEGIWQTVQQQQGSL